MSLTPRYARCHPRLLARDAAGRCAKCRDERDVARMRRTPPRPARIYGVAQHGFPVLPAVCPKCHSRGESDGDTFHCLMCGSYYERTVGEGQMPVKGPGPKGVLA